MSVASNNNTNNQSAFILTDDNIKEAVASYISGNSSNLPEISLWDTSQITDMSELFESMENFNLDISNWNVSNVRSMSNMFQDASSFNQPLNNWNVSNVQDMSNMFVGATMFNQPLNNWDVSQVTDMKHMFEEATAFNQPLNDWNVSQVTDMTSMFEAAENFNQPLNNWDVSQVFSMENMFAYASRFNQNINDWNVSNVRNMKGMFYAAINFNQPLNDWDVSNVENMTSMFAYAILFNQPLNQWDLSNIEELNYIFNGCRAYNQNLSNWYLHHIGDFQLANVFSNMPSMDQSNYPSRAIRAINNVGNDPLLQHQQQEQVEATMGVAYEVHEAFKLVDFSRLFQLINNGIIEHYNGSKAFKYYLFDELKKLAENYSGSDKTEVKTKLNSLSNKLTVINFDTQFNMTPNPNGADAFFTVLNFIKRQDKKYQDNYIKFFTTDCFTSYDSGLPGSDQSSCVKGIKERLVFALGQAGFDSTNNLYKQISSALYPIKDSQIYIYMNSCINNDEIIQELKSLNIEQRKQLILDCIKQKIHESEPSVDVESMNARINDLISKVQDMLSDESITGGKRIKLGKKLYHIKLTRKMRKTKKHKKTKIVKSKKKSYDSKKYNHKINRKMTRKQK